MAYYTTTIGGGSVVGPRRPTINDLFLSAYTVGIYAGCEFGCQYCDGWNNQLRPFNETISIPTDLPARLEQELRTLDRGDLLGITARTDAYQPAERTQRIARQTLQTLAAYGQPFTLLTKSPAVLEDLPTLQAANAASLGLVIFTLLTTDRRLAEKLEGRAPTPAERLDALSRLRAAGIPAGVALVPLIPYVNDTDQSLSRLVAAVVDAGADFLVWDTLHIPSERHRARVAEMVQRVGSYPPSYYRELYGDRTTPDLLYQSTVSARLLELCDQYHLPVRPPQRLFRNQLSPRNSAALLLKHAAFRDATQGRPHLAEQARQLAAAIYADSASPADILSSPLATELISILG